MTFLIRNALSLLVLLFMVGFSLALYGGLPEQVPTGYGFNGEASGTTPRLLLASVLPFSFLAVLAVINPLIRLSPEKFSMPDSRYAIDIIVFATGVLMAFIHFALLIAAGDYQVFLDYFSIGFAAFLLIAGNVFGKTEPNFIIGIRLPWTLVSKRNWKVTHRLAGRLMVVGGLLLYFSNSLYPSLVALLVFSVSPLLVAVVYSPYFYHRFERSEQAQGLQAV